MNRSPFLYLLLSLFISSCNHLMADEEATAFEYREIHLPDGYTSEGKALGLNNIDQDWGLWGHHLGTVLPASHSHSVYATQDGRPSEEQFCFSSDKLYEYICTYVRDNFGTKHTQRFAILPNDNSIVCQCRQCVARGCTPEDATPAVSYMLERLAARFPHHQFFTSYYLTTHSLPTRPMPANTGVLISAITFPLSTHTTPQEEAFTRLLKDWAQLTPNIYIWDYINNFDDYFTPYPVLTVMQHRFRLYASAGVRGIFLNGSGTEYSTFSRIHTHLLSELMCKPDANWRTLLTQTCDKLYPVTGSTIAHFILQQEDSLQDQPAPLPLYEGMEVARHNYLHETDFTTFHDQLLHLLPQTKGKEHHEISLLVRALMLPRLELKRIHAQTADTQSMLEQLASLEKEGIHVYSETCWTIDDYVKEYDKMARHAQSTNHINRLLGQTLLPLTALDEGYTDISILTDGLLGLPSNYHCGHFISSADPTLRIVLPKLPGLRRVCVGLISNQQFHIGLPRRVTLTSGDNEIGSIVPHPTTAVAQRTTLEFEVPQQVETPLTITLYHNPEAHTMAIDEIEAY
ncbi:MAG: DUF4838 domain-containing protein [Bacteroidaceae bacterium]|nr:DUF4838 domain-containing protein [Bacteroidaceae bacterium]